MADDMSRQIEQLNKAGAIMVGTKEGTPVSRESAQAIVEAIRKQQEKKQVTDDIVTRLRHKYAGQLPICAEAAEEIERLRRENAWFKAVNIQMNADLTELSNR